MRFAYIDGVETNIISNKLYIHDKYLYVRLKEQCAIDFEISKKTFVTLVAFVTTLKVKKIKNINLVCKVDFADWH